MHKTPSQLAAEVLRCKEREKTALLARLYAMGRGLGEAAAKIPRISVGGPQALVKPISAKQALKDVEKKFLEADTGAREYLTRKVSPKLFEGSNALFRMAGVPPKTREWAAKRVATHSPLYLTAPLPAVPPFLAHPIGQLAWTLGGPTTTFAKRLARIPTREDLLHKVLETSAKKRGFKNLEQRMLFESDPGYLPTQALGALERASEGLLKRVRAKGSELNRAELDFLRRQTPRSPGLSSIV